MAEPVARCGADAVVPHFELEVVRPVRERHVRAAGPRVLECVRQALLDDPVSRKLDGAGKQYGSALHVKLNRQSCPADALHERVEAVETGLRCELGVLSVVHRTE
jgi:hypothetical protein